MLSLAQVSKLQASILGHVQAIHPEGVPLLSIKDNFCKGKSYVARSAIENLNTIGVVDIKEDKVYWSGIFPNEV